MLILFQTLMSALRILTTVARGKPLVQTPQDHSSALVSLGSLEMGTTAKVKSLKPNIIYLKKNSLLPLSAP